MLYFISQMIAFKQCGVIVVFMLLFGFFPQEDNKSASLPYTSTKLAALFHLLCHVCFPNGVVSRSSFWKMFGVFLSKPQHPKYPNCVQPREGVTWHLHRNPHMSPKIS